jgi:predicted nucleic acid-binding protein
LLGRYEVAVWWGTPVEIRSALERLLRLKELSANEHAGAEKRLEQLRKAWTEIQPETALRAQAEKLLRRFPLRAADALQLAAAMTWTLDRPQGRPFICGDAALLEAGQRLGFQAIEA